MALQLNEYTARKWTPDKVKRYPDLQWQKALLSHVFNSPEYEPSRGLNIIYQELAEKNTSWRALLKDVERQMPPLRDMG